MAVNTPLPVYDGFLPGRHIMEGFGKLGFRFGGMSHQGPILILPSGVGRWDVTIPYRHDAVQFRRVFDEAASIEILLIGTGTMPIPLPVPLREAFRAQGISVDVMITASAASTYNVLLSENRRVAAALIAVA